MKQDSIYITTTLPYVNGSLHIGHALEFVQADVLARYNRLQGKEVLFNTGTDEHGLKNFRTAKEKGMSTQELVDFYVEENKKFCELFQISFDAFTRTTDEHHKKAAQKFWEKSMKAGDIYKKEYEGYYCVGCEEFKVEKDLVDGKCPQHKKKLEKHAEENYFFKFSKYQDKLLEIYEENTEFVKPKDKLGEIKAFVSRGLKDFSISRSKENLPWGIDVPGDDSQVMYVWFDALVNYVSAIGYGVDDKKFKKWWPVVQFCGPDNLRFQSAMWQAMLLSVGIEPSETILVHGMMLAEDGTKMSKSVGNVVDPKDLLHKYGLEPVRFYLAAGVPTFSDVSFSHSHLEGIYNSHLKNGFGNLLNRVVTLSKRKEIGGDYKKDVEQSFKAKIQKEFLDKYNESFESYQIYSAFQEAFKLSDFGNLYITENEPWGRDKDPKQVQQVLLNLQYLLSVLIGMYECVVPSSMEKAKKALKSLDSIILFQELESK